MPGKRSRNGGGNGERVNPVDPAATLRNALAVAIGHHQNGELGEAERLYRLIVEVQPDHPVALNNLGLMVTPAEAVDLFKRAIAAEPNYVDALVNLSSALAAQGELGAADDAYQRAVMLIHDDPDALFRLAHVLQSQGRSSEAVAQYKRAVEIRPDFVSALCNLGLLYSSFDDADAASGYFRRALGSDPGHVPANLNLAGLLESEGRLREAKIHRDRVPHPQRLSVLPGTEATRTVLVLANACSGNVPVEALLPSDRNTRITWHVEFATDAQERELPPYDVAFNAIGNADLMADSVDRVTRLHERQPILNPPSKVAHTRRDLMPALLACIPDTIVPIAVRLDRDRLSDAASHIPYPMLIRPAVAHGGEGLALIETPEAFARLVVGRADAYYVTAFHDFRSADGYYRKYRMIFVDRKAYPYHLAIADTWLVHYYTADMMAAPWKRDEEQRFLDNPGAVLGSKIMTALAAIAGRLDLDYAGIDFSVDADGHLLVFEANATMLVHLYDSVKDFPYKHIHVPKITQAFDAMLERHALKTR